MNTIREYYEEHPMGEPGVESSKEEVLLRQEIIFQNVSNLSPNIILDIGCGKGYLANYISPNYEYNAFDISISSINYALKNNKKLTVNPQSKKINFFVANATNIPIRDEILDLIICSEVIEHIPKYEILIKEISRIVRKNGYCIITTPNYFNTSVFLRMLIKGKNTYQIYDKPVPYYHIINLFKKNNMNNMSFQYFYIHHPLSNFISNKIKYYLDKIFDKLFFMQLYIIIIFCKPVYS